MRVWQGRLALARAGRPDPLRLRGRLPRPSAPLRMWRGVDAWLHQHGRTGDLATAVARWYTVLLAFPDTRMSWLIQDHIHRVAFTARWVGGGDGCSHYNVSLAIRTSLDGNTFDEVPAVVLELQGALATTASARHRHAADDAAGAVLRHCETHVLHETCAGAYPPPPPPVPPPPCTPAKNTTSCNPRWNCQTCRVPTPSAPDTPSDCLSCAAGYTFAQASTDCTGHCTKGKSVAAATTHERSTPAIAVGEMAGRFLSVVASVAEHKATGRAQAVGCALGNFSVVATLIADPTR